MTIFSGRAATSAYVVFASPLPLSEDELHCNPPPSSPRVPISRAEAGGLDLLSRFLVLDGFFLTEVTVAEDIAIYSEPGLQSHLVP